MGDKWVQGWCSNGTFYVLKGLLSQWHAQAQALVSVLCLCSLAGISVSIKLSSPPFPFLHGCSLSGSTGEGTAVSGRRRNSGWKRRSACWRPRSKRSGNSWGWRGGAYSGAPPTEMEAPPLSFCSLEPPSTPAPSRSLQQLSSNYSAWCAR